MACRDHEPPGQRQLQRGAARLRGERPVEAIRREDRGQAEVPAVPEQAGLRAGQLRSPNGFENPSKTRRNGPKTPKNHNGTEHILLENAFSDPRLSLEDEANTMMSLCHPNIVKCHSWFQTHTSLYLALELVEGGDLLHCLLETGCFPECQAPTYRSDRLYRLYIGYIIW